MNEGQDPGRESVDDSQFDVDSLLSGDTHEVQDDVFSHNQDIIASESIGFDKFNTIDLTVDSLIANNKKLHSFASDANASHIVVFFHHLMASSRSWVCLTLIGVLVGLIAAVLTIITEYLNNIKTGYCSTNFYLNRNFCCWGEDVEQCQLWVPWSSFAPLNYLVFVVFSVVLAATAGILVQKYAPFAAGSGISEIKCIVSGFEMKNFLSWPTLFVKAMGLPLAIASGLSIGKEGPSVHYAVAAGHCITSLFSDYSNEFGHLSEFLTASSAAGVAVAFGSPIGGVLFSIEEINGNFRLSTLWKSYFCSLVAISTLAFVNPFRTGQLVMFEVKYDESWHIFELPFFILLGIFGGFYGIIVSKYNIKVVSFRKKYLQNYAVKELILLSSISAIFCYFNEFLRLDMTESMEILFHECGVGFEHRLCNIEGHKLKLFLSLVFATGFRMILTIISYGCKVPCGIFVPSMAAGATFGRAVGIVVDNFRQSNPEAAFFSACSSDKKCITPGTYAFLGAAAGLSGITDLTVTVVVIMFEVTGALRYVIPTMIVVGVTKIINDKWGHGAIADQMIKFNGLPFIDPKEAHIFNLNVECAMTSETKVISVEKACSTTEIQEILEDEKKYQDIPLVSSVDSPFLVGYINRAYLESIVGSDSKLEDDLVCDFSTEEDKQNNDSTLYFHQFVNESPITISQGTSMEEVMDIFFKTGPRTVFVEDKGILKGLVTRKDIIKFERYLEKIEHHNFDINKIRREQDTGSLNADWQYKLFTLLKRFDDKLSGLLKMNK